MKSATGIFIKRVTLLPPDLLTPIDCIVTCKFLWIITGLHIHVVLYSPSPPTPSDEAVYWTVLVHLFIFFLSPSSRA